MSDELEKLAGYYKAAITGVEGDAILLDLNQFCCGTRTTANGPYSIEVMEGRRQVLNHIMTILGISPQSLIELQEMASNEDVYRLNEKDPA